MSNKLDTPLVGLQDPRGTPLRRGNPATVELLEIPFPEIINLRGNPDDATFVRKASEAVGAPLPVTPNTVGTGKTHVACWVGPDEWLVRSAQSVPDAETGGLARKVDQALAGQFFAVTDQSSAYSVMQLSGPQARAVLSKGCPLDLSPEVMGAGKCAQSHYFGASVLLRPLDDTGHAWEIIVRRSFADATARILLDAMDEYV